MYPNITLLHYAIQTKVEVVLSLQTSQGDILRVEGVTVPGLVQPVESLLPPGAVEFSCQVVQGITETKFYREELQSSPLEVARRYEVLLKP